MLCALCCTHFHILLSFSCFAYNFECFYLRYACTCLCLHASLCVRVCVCVGMLICLCACTCTCVCECKPEKTESLSTRIVPNIYSTALLQARMYSTNYNHSKLEWCVFLSLRMCLLILVTSYYAAHVISTHLHCMRHTATD